MSFATGNTETIFNGVIEGVEVVSESAGFWSTSWSVISLIPDVIVLVFSMLWFDYAFLTGDWIFLRFIFMTISIGMIVSLFLAMRGTSSS